MAGDETNVRTELRECHKCCKKGQGFRRCGGCRRVFYCSKECQREDWTCHKHLCKVLALTPDRPVANRELANMYLLKAKEFGEAGRAKKGLDLLEKLENLQPPSSPSEPYYVFSFHSLRSALAVADAKSGTSEKEKKKEVFLASYEDSLVAWRVASSPSSGFDSVSILNGANAIARTAYDIGHFVSPLDVTEEMLRQSISAVETMKNLVPIESLTEQNDVAMYQDLMPLYQMFKKNLVLLKEFNEVRKAKGDEGEEEEKEKEEKEKGSAGGAATNAGESADVKTPQEEQ